MITAAPPYLSLTFTEVSGLAWLDQAATVMYPLSSLSKTRSRNIFLLSMCTNGCMFVRKNLKCQGDAAEKMDFS